MVEEFTKQHHHACNLCADCLFVQCPLPYIFSVSMVYVSSTIRSSGTCCVEHSQNKINLWLYKRRMANTTLLISATLCGMLHFAWMLHSKYHPILLMYTIGIIASIANHGFTNIGMKTFDRFWMLLATCVNLYYATMALDYVAIMCVILYSLAYLMAKVSLNVYNNAFLANSCQVLTHILATYANYRIGYWVANLRMST